MNTSLRSSESQAAGTPSAIPISRVTRSIARMMNVVTINVRGTRIPQLMVPCFLPKEPSWVSRSMQSMYLTRLRKELEDITVDPPANCSAKLIGDNIYKWEVTLIGTSDSPYENGIFKLRLNFPVNYPFAPPDVRFVTKIYHSNVSQDGMICLDVFRSQWSPAICVSKILLSIQLMFKDANPHDPLHTVAAETYINNRQVHDALARRWTQLYAK